MKRGVVHPRVPCLQQHQRRGWHDPPPLLGIEEHDDEENTSDNKAVHVDEVPNACNANGVSIARCANQRRNITGIIFGGPDAVAWEDLDRCNPDPLAAWRTAVIKIKTRMIHQYRNAAAN